MDFDECARELIEKYAQQNNKRQQRRDEEEHELCREEEDEVEVLVKLLHAIQQQIADRGCVVFSHVADPHMSQRIRETTAISTPPILGRCAIDSMEALCNSALKICVEDISKLWKTNVAMMPHCPQMHMVFERPTEDDDL